MASGSADAGYRRAVARISFGSVLPLLAAVALAGCGTGILGGPHRSPTPVASENATPPTLQSVDKRLVTTADVPGSSAVPLSSGNGSDPRNAVSPCLHPGSGQGYAGSAQVAATEVQQPQSQPGAETVVEVVLLYGGAIPAAAAQQATNAMIQLQSGVRACAPQSTDAAQTPGGIADSESTVTSQVALGPWTGMRSIDAVTATSSTASLRVVHHVYYVMTPHDPFIVLELDIAVSGVTPSQPLQQQADDLATTLALRLAT